MENRKIGNESKQQRKKNKQKSISESLNYFSVLCVFFKGNIYVTIFQQIPLGLWLCL